MINKIAFTNYKSFKKRQELELKPITVLIGKNSSGKSAIAKLPVLIDNSFNNVSGEPYTMEYNGVQFGDEYRDIFYERIPNAVLEFEMTSEDDKSLLIKVVSDYEKSTIPNIYTWKLNNHCELTFNRINGSYTDILHGVDYLCEFDGFNLVKLADTKDKVLDNEFYLKDINIKTDYIGPFRKYANEMRTFQLKTLKNFDTVGVEGENAYYILGIESTKKESNLVKSVDEWYKTNFDGWGIKVNTDVPSFCKIELTREDRKFDINIADAGQGMSQALPLIVNAFLPGNDYLTIIEQPELHLHPAAHGNLAELFADSAIKFDKRYLIETHSQNFVLRLRRLIAEGKFKNSDLQIYWVDYDGVTNSSSLKPIKVNELGEVDAWPDNIFTETLDETIAIRTAQVNRKDGN